MIKTTDDDYTLYLKTMNTDERQRFALKTEAEKYRLLQAFILVQKMKSNG